MDTPFVHDTYVQGKNFLGRKSECTVLKNLIEKKENICIYEPPKAGKMSLIQQTLFNMRVAGKQFISIQTDLFNIRSLEQFLIKTGSAVIRGTASTPAEYEGIISTMLEGTHFRFDQERFSQEDQVLTLEGIPDDNDIKSLLQLPGRIAASRETPVYVVIKEFQNLLILDELVYEKIFRLLLEVMEETDKETAGSAIFILTGSMVNAMKLIFEEKRYFYRKVERVPLMEIDTKEIIEYVVRGFLSSGKVIERELVMGAANLFKNNMWYINHFTAICDSLSKGYMNEGILMDALRIIISIHEPRFKAIANDLTSHQMNLVRAIIDGEKKFSSTEVIEKYGFNSSANVRRIKDALKKKEIITFDEKDEPMMLDPLFEYWIEKHYFERR